MTNREACVLRIENLVAGYGPTTVLNGIDLQIRSGQRLALLGRNGVGKTTLLRTIMGLTKIKHGVVMFNGEDITRLAPHQRAELGLGLVPQTRDIFKSLTVQENLIAGIKRANRSEITEAYSLFPRLADRRHHLGNQLSGGEQQMLAVARTLLGKPSMLLLDEPLEGLAPIIRQELLAAFQHISTQSQLSVLIVEQQVHEALGYADSATIMERGKIVFNGGALGLKNDQSTLDRYIGMDVH
jgi:branched-chain amino acid transport system ATP-binding protein